MEQLLNFKLGWLNKERLLFVLGLAFIVFGIYSFLFNSNPGYRKMDKVAFSVNEEALVPPRGYVSQDLVARIAFPEAGAKFFMLLDAPQLELPAPVPPDFGLPVVLPPAFPQPSSSGNKNSSN
jgi:hypothetical protein